MVKGEDIRKLSDVELELYLLGVEEVERERDKLRENNFTEEEIKLISKMSFNTESDINDCFRRTEDFPKAFVEYCRATKPIVDSILEKVRKV